MVSSKKSSTAASRQQLLQKVREFSVKGAVKRAALGGEQETAFEQSFASLAYSYIQDKAPGLIDFLVGFQLVEKNDDNTRAVGIFGFKIGEQWAYIPVFFLSGDLRGHELLYLKNQDSFVPLSEDRVNNLIAKKPHILGQPEFRNERDLGIMEPNLSSLSNPPTGGKYASDKHAPNIPNWLKPAMPKLAEWITTSPNAKHASLADKLDFRKFISSDVRLVKLARDISRAYPQIKQALDNCYGANLLADTLVRMRQDAISNAVLSKRAGNAIAQEELRKNTEQKAKVNKKKREGILLPKDAAADVFAKIEVVTDVLITENLPEMNEQERQKLLRDGYLIRDHRNGKEISRAYNTQVEMALTNPDKTDVYQVLTKPGDFEKCLAIVNPFTGGERKNFVTLVRLADGKKGYKNAHATRVFVKQQARSKSDEQEFSDWYKSLSDNTGSNLQVGALYVAISANGDGTVPFEVREKLEDGRYRVWWEEYGETSRADYLPERASPVCCGPSLADDGVVCFNGRKGTKLKSVGGLLYLPEDVKVIKIKEAPKCRSCKKLRDSCTCDYFHTDYESEKGEPLLPGNLQDLQLQIMSKTAELKVWTDHHELVINRQRMAKLAGLVHLVRGYGLCEKQAKQILKDAERSGGVRYRVKLAQPFDPYAAMQGPGGPAMMDPMMGADPAYGGVPTMYPMEQMQAVPEMSAANTDPSIYDPMQMIDPMAMQAAQAGQQQGQKEIFDTTLIASMLKAIREDSLIDRYLGSLINALDKLGRILFLLYWHHDKFRDRYGKQDLPELEDTTRNAFEILGDLVLLLRQKSIQPNQGTQQFGESSDDISVGI
jgi:hypothetical protein